MTTSGTKVPVRPFNGRLPFRFIQRRPPTRMSLRLFANLSPPAFHTPWTESGLQRPQFQPLTPGGLASLPNRGSAVTIQQAPIPAYLSDARHGAPASPGAAALVAPDAIARRSASRFQFGRVLWPSRRYRLYTSCGRRTRLNVYIGFRELQEPPQTYTTTSFLAASSSKARV